MAECPLGKQALCQLSYTRVVSIVYSTTTNVGNVCLVCQTVWRGSHRAGPAHEGLHRVYRHQTVDTFDGAGAAAGVVDVG